MLSNSLSAIVLEEKLCRKLQFSCRTSTFGIISFVSSPFVRKWELFRIRSAKTQNIKRNESWKVLHPSRQPPHPPPRPPPPPPPPRELHLCNSFRTFPPSRCFFSDRKDAPEVRPSCEEFVSGGWMIRALARNLRYLEIFIPLVRVIPKTSGFFF